MQGQLSSQRELFSTIDLDEFVPNDHLLRKVDRIVDFDFLYELTAELYCPDNGRPSIDPVLFFRMQLILSVRHSFGSTAMPRYSSESRLSLVLSCAPGRQRPGSFIVDAHTW